tara:strand:- start:304 stop:891 length:588 start_codon:yes stop_codon:yes gene_type:complete
MSDFYYHGTGRAPWHGMTSVDAQKKIRREGLGIHENRATASKLPDDPARTHKFGQKVHPLSPYKADTGVVFKVPDGKDLIDVAEDFDNPEGIRAGKKTAWNKRVPPKYVSGYVTDGIYESVSDTIKSQKGGFLDKFAKGASQVSRVGGTALGVGMELIDPPELNQGSEVYPTDPNPRESVMHPDYDKGFLERMFN